MDIFITCTIIQGVPACVNVKSNEFTNNILFGSMIDTDLVFGVTSTLYLFIKLKKYLIVWMSGVVSGVFRLTIS